MSNEWYNLKQADKQDSPVLLVFPDRVKANIQTAISMVANVTQLRPHVKTNKSAQATQLMLDAGIIKFKCATIAEAENAGYDQSARCCPRLSAIRTQAASIH
jgi:D-serine deaminase-like pyridoxal phosphate-dependent protein